jgi:hypothetical protein
VFASSTTFAFTNYFNLFRTGAAACEQRCNGDVAAARGANVIHDNGGDFSNTSGDDNDDGDSGVVAFVKENVWAIVLIVAFVVFACSYALCGA